jgi:type IV pilus assembly protein PilQ
MAGPQNSLSHLVVKQQGRSTVIQVDATSRPMFTVYKLDNPARLTVDVANCTMGEISDLGDSGRGPTVKQVETIQVQTDSTSIARIVASLRQPSHYTVRAIRVEGTNRHRLVVKVTPYSKGAQAAKAKPRVEQQRAEAQVRRELEQQQEVAKAAEDAAAQMRKAANEAQKRLSRATTSTERKAAQQQLRQARRRVKDARRARQKAEQRLTNLRQVLAKMKPAGESSIKDIRFVDGSRTVKVVIDVEGRPKHRVQTHGGQPMLELKAARLPRMLRRTLDTSEFNGPVTQVTSYVSDPSRKTVSVKVGLRQSSSAHRIHWSGKQLIWEFDKPSKLALGPARDAARTGSKGLRKDYTYKSTRVAAARAKRKSRRRRYVGRRIDLDFKGASIHNILRLLAEVGNMNVITGDNVKGSVTIRLKNVPWDQALDVILRAKGLGMVKEGNLIRVAPRKTLEKEREAEIARMKQVVMLKPLETRLIPISYARARAITGQLRYLMSPRGKLSVDKRTNMIIARDLSSNLDLMERLIRNLDTQTPQIQIEARIVEARTNYSRDIGIQWGGSFTASAANGNATGLVFPNQIGIGGAVPGGTTAGILLGQASNPNFVVSYPAVAVQGGGGGIGLTLGSVSGNVNINLRLTAAEAQGDLRIVSAPKVTTLDNVNAKISQGVTIPYSQISASGVSTTFKSASLSLNVRPHVTADGSVIMRIRVSNNEPDFVNTGAGGAPTILTKSASTQVMVKDGETTVIGGIYSIRTGRNWQKIPWFAEIPILGWFFRHKQDISDRSEVLVFITPMVINRPQSIGG